MNPSNWFALLCPWLALVRLLQLIAARGRLRKHGSGRLLLLCVAALGVLAVPVNGFALGWWVRGVAASFSIPLTLLLAVQVWEAEFSQKLLGPRDWVAGWAFGTVAGVVLYPCALGWGNSDPYEWGWSFSPLFIGAGAIAAVLLWQQNRFGLLLLLAIAAWQLHLLESRNYWDYLVDPVYFVTALIALGYRLFRSSRRHRAGANAA